MTKRQRILGAVFTLLGLPLLLALYEAVDFHFRNRNNGSVVSSGVEREYLLHVPKSYDASRPTPLVVTLHGGALWPAIQQELSGWSQVADRHGFLVVYPAGLRLGGTGPRGWRVTRPGPDVAKEVRFIADLVDTVAKSYNVDPARVYANGLSNGGGMTFVLSCMLSERFAAFGLVASAQMLPWDWCRDPQPAPMISFHGTGDKVTPFDGGNTFAVPGDLVLPGVMEWTENWARRNRCASNAVESTVAADVTRREYTGCADDTAVVLYTIHGGGHTWPGGKPVPEWFMGRTSRGVDASAEMWAFFEKYHSF